ncbi:MAG: hypothetical protein HYT71_01850 [Candidatus Aenigmarchaeota archaeon]|nr:hypothetical protein [Candidatus Aenigmarchaeota archaeon]
MKKISLVGWDADRVIYDDLFTSVCAMQSKSDPMPYVEKFIRDGWFSLEDVENWCAIKKIKIKTIEHLAQMLTEFYSISTKNGTSIINHEQVIEAKHSLLRGFTIEQIEQISSKMVYTKGFVECANIFKDNGIKQTMFSDGPNPHVLFQIKKLGFQSGGGVNHIVEYDGKEVEYDSNTPKHAKLTGKIVPFDKAEAFFKYVSSQGCSLSEVAVIDDSAGNVESLLLPVHNAGGLAVGFNVTERHKPVFRKFGIPVIKGNDLSTFKEIVLNFCD